ncbi:MULTISPECIES: hypothetical protein [unclassified Ruegeria]|uniref:hypothetical protein n=1 Tax=unclassified Ruegeria TaxID=2625375 RepID=UPI0014887DC1|nr:MULTISPECIES: hypothetical protein [unclassified Ruegeria]NOD85929.1 hypothetical protein [Ruegeria sp. HKCCD6119]
MQEFTREELYELAWQKPMARLAQEFGLSDQGLAKICAKHAIPRPPRGYWAKLEAGKPVEKTALPPQPDGVSRVIRIAGPSQFKAKAMENASNVRKAAKVVGEVTIPGTLRALHPVVSAWVSDHREEQAKRRAEHRANRHDTWWVTRVPIDLTERDRYRFRVTSALLKSFEAAGGRALEGNVRGKLTPDASGERFEMSVVEKMRQFRGKPSEEPGDWTAFPHFHGGNLAPTGYLRFTITTYIGEGMRKEWLETQKSLAPKILPSVVAGLLAVGPALVERRRDREDWQRRYEEEQRERAERQRLARLEEERWERFRSLASDWHEVQRLRSFMAALEQKGDHVAAEIDGMTRAEWLAWARNRIDGMDPLKLSSKG